ncbi:MAG: hypothetical protein KAX49_03555 [Halanaerobiales bacterium]|nr:hypothetical protein [Halanaerobiales bacterium]
MNIKLLRICLVLFIPILVLLSVWAYQLDTEGFTKVTNIINPFVSIINLAFITTFYLYDKHLRLKEERYKNKLYWYRTYVTEKNMGVIIEFFDKCFKIANESNLLRNDFDSKVIKFHEFNGGIKGKFKTFTEQKMKLRKAFVDFIGIIDTEFEEKINSALEKYQDEFTNMLHSFSYGKKEYKDLVDLIGNQKKKLLKQIYEYEMNMVV